MRKVRCFLNPSISLLGSCKDLLSNWFTLKYGHSQLTLWKVALSTSHVYVEVHEVLWRLCKQYVLNLSVSEHSYLINILDSRTLEQIRNYYGCNIQLFLCKGAVCNGLGLVQLVKR